MNYDLKYCKQAKVIIRKAIALRPMSKDELVAIAYEQQLPYAARAMHEAAWSMAEEGEAFWNKQWLLEPTSDADCMPNFREQLQAEVASKMTDIKLTYVYRIFVSVSETEQIYYGSWRHVGWNCTENLLYFDNRYGGQLQIPMNPETGEPDAPWIVEPISKLNS